MATDYYAILGVARGADDVVIQAAYRALMRKYHPDTNTGADATTRAAKINEAYAVLSDPAKRATYDARFTDEPPHPPPPPPNDAPSPAGVRATGDLATIRWLIAITIFGVIGLSLAASERKPPRAPVMSPPPAFLAKPRETHAFAPTPNANSTISVTPTEVADSIGSRFSGPPPPPTVVSFNDIEAAAFQFDRVLQRKGIVGARAYSERCHREVADSPTWETADRCAAFDFAAAHFDAEMSVASKGAIRADNYFVFQADNQSANYAALGVAPYVIDGRLMSIRHAAEPVVDQVIQDRLATDQAQR